MTTISTRRPSRVKVVFGNPGVPGMQGTQGIQGPSGGGGGGTSNGSQGIQGTQGLQGNIGLQGVQGVQGFEGMQGLQGVQGTRGNTGFQGIQGPQGLQGNTGVQGIQGTLGLQGLQGNTGFQGVQGTTGTGIQGLQGPAGPAGAGSGVINVAANTALAFNTTTNVLSTIYNTSIADTVDSIAVGGAAVANAGVWKTKNIVEVLDTILFPDQLPTYTNPTISFSGTVSGTQEIGSSITQSMTSVGTKNDANTFTQIVFRRGGATLHTNTSLNAATTSNVADQFGYSNPNNPNFTYTGTNTNIYTVTAGSTSWDAVGSYNAGVAKRNNKGVTDTRTPAIRSTSAPQAACTSFTSSSVSISGIYPYFWGKSSTQPTAASIAADIAAGTTNKVLASSSGTVTVTYNASSEFIWLAHIATDTSKTKWYNTALNNGDIGAGQFILSPVTQNVNSPQGFWTAQSFKIYISGFATTTSGSIEFRNI